MTQDSKAPEFKKVDIKYNSTKHQFEINAEIEDENLNVKSYIKEKLNLNI